MYPFTILNEKYVVQIETLNEEDKVLAIDGDVISTLIVTYALTVKIKNNESGEEYDNRHENYSAEKPN